MEKKLKKALSLVLAFSMVMSLLSVTAFAEGDDISIDTLLGNVTTATSELETAKTEAEAAEDAYSDAIETALADETSDIAVAQAAADKAETACQTANTELEEAQAAYAEAEAAYNDAVAAGEATEELKAAKEQAAAALEEAETAANGAQETLSAAETALTAANEALEAEKEKLPEYTAWQNALETQAEKQAALEAAEKAVDNYYAGVAAPVVALIEAIETYPNYAKYAQETGEGQQEALEAAVATAREKYDLLSDDAKAKVTNLDVLTSAEIHLTAEYGESKWQKESVKTYTTTDGISVTIDRENDEGALVLNKSNRIYFATVTVEIPETFEEDKIEIDLMDAMDTVFDDLTPHMPGERLMFNVRIINHSAYDYAYTKNSMYITDANLDGEANYYGPISAEMEGLYSYTGNPICTYGSMYRMANRALGKYGLKCTTLESLSDENLGQKLIDAGYPGGIKDLAKYYIDYYNNYYNTDHTRLDEFTDKQLSAIFNANNYPGGIETYEQLITETNKEVAETGYNFFYNSCLSFGVTSYSTVDGLTYSDVSSATVAGATSRYGAYIANGELDGAFSALDLSAGETDCTNFVYFTIDGPLTTNFLACMNIGLEMGLALERLTTYSVVANYYTDNSLDNSTPVELLSDEATTVDTVITVASNDAIVTDHTTYGGNSYTFDADRSTMTITAVADPAGNIITLNYYRTTGGGGGDPTPTPTPTPTDPTDPTTPTDPTDPGGSTDIGDDDVPMSGDPTDIGDDDVPMAGDPTDGEQATAPKTGDLSALWLALTALSGSGLAGVTLLGRKRREDEE